MSVYKVVAHWAQGIMVHAKPRQPQSAHLDELLSDWPDTAQDRIRLARLSLEALIDVVGDKSEQLQCVLCWPLDDVEEMDIRPPAQLSSGEEPPSLYITDRRAALIANDSEEYRTVLEPSNYGISLPGVVATYHCVRDREAQQEGWEFGRMIMFTHFPRGYR